MDRHLPHVTRERKRELPAGIRDPEHCVGKRDRVVRSAVVIGEDRRQLVDHGHEGVRTSHRDDGDGRFAERGHRVDELHLLRREILVRGVRAFSFSALVRPCRSAADREDDDIGIPRGSDCRRNVGRLFWNDAGARNGGDLSLRHELSHGLGERQRRVIGLDVVPAIDFEHRRQLGRDRGFPFGRRAAAKVDSCHRDVTTGGSSVHHLQR